MDDDIKSNGWEIKKITDFNNAEDFIAIVQNFCVTQKVLVNLKKLC